MFRGVAGFDIFEDDLDRRVFLSQARDSFDGTALRCLTWSLMDNHGHLASQTQGGSLSTGMHRLETRYAMYFNRRNQRRGHVVQNRFKSLLLDEETYLLRVVRYVMLNPVEGGIVRSLEELEDYPWTSYPALLGRSQTRLGDTSFTLRLFADGEDAARRELRAWMREGLHKRDPIASLLEASPGRPDKILQSEIRAASIGERDATVVGDSRFIAKILTEAVDPSATFQQAAADGWTLAGIIARICADLDVSADELRAGRRFSAISQARAATAWIGNARLGLSLTEIAAEVGASRQALSQSLRRGEAVACDALGDLLVEISVGGGAE